MAVQACHAAMEAGRHLWDDGEHPSIVLLAVPDEETLLKKKSDVEERGIKTRIFFESDFGQHHSAFATEPIEGEDRKVFANDRLLRLENRC